MKPGHGTLKRKYLNIMHEEQTTRYEEEEVETHGQHSRN